jgi:integrase
VIVNRFIKTVAYQCGINEVLRWEATKYGKRYNTEAPKWKLITCHTGRRTAASNMYRAGIKTLDIMKLTGHRSEKSFLQYIRLTNEEVALELSKHPYFTGTTLKIAR